MQPIDTPEGLVVYADWLLAQGNPQGELIIVQRARQSATRSPAAQRALRLREDELLHKHGAELAGPLPKAARLCWRSGFVRELSATFSNHEGEMLAEALRRPAFALLEHVAISTYEEAWPRALTEAIGALRQLRSVELSPRDSLDLSFLPATIERLTLRASVVALPALPQLRSLSLFCERVEGLSLAAQPSLARLTTTTVTYVNAFRGLELHTLDLALSAADIARISPRRAVVTIDGESGPDFAAGDVLRDFVQAGERAFVVLEGEGAEVKRGLERVGALPIEGSLIAAAREVGFGGKRITAVELRSNEPQPSLLRLLCIDLVGLLGRPVLEVALSRSSAASLFRAHERIGSSVTTWVAGRAAGEGEGAADGFRRAVDRLFGLDPGFDAMSEVLLALDGTTPEVLRGERPKRDELPCCTPIEATLETGDEDEEEPEYEDEEDAYDDDAYDDEDDSREWLDPVVSVLEAVGAAVADDEDEDDEPFRDAADADIEEVLTQTPVALDDELEDGVERNPEQGLETDPAATDPDSITALAACEACRLNPAQQTCSRCGAEICEGCVTLESPVTCRDCRPATQPAVAAVAPAQRTRNT